MSMSRIITMQSAVALLAFAAGLAYTATIYAQAEQTPENLLDEPLQPPEEEAQAPEEELEDAPASRETDFNEENFRRSMELRDQALQRSPALTTGTYSGATGVDLLDDLPETSQKHLRSELREVIVRNGPWSPDQAGVVYPYIPSEAARENGSLAQREQAAWGNLVDKYHEREAAIHANAARTQAATARQMAAEGSEGSKEGPEGSKEGPEGSKEDKPQENPAGEGNETTRGEPRSAEENASSRPANVQGVSQNALELLTRREQLPPSATSSATPQATSEEARLDEKRGATDSQEGKEGQGRDSPEIDLESEDVIAIDDLENVRLDAQESEEN